jgi:hypothetical protein
MALRDRLRRDGAILDLEAVDPATPAAMGAPA